MYPDLLWARVLVLVCIHVSSSVQGPGLDPGSVWVRSSLLQDTHPALRPGTGSQVLQATRTNLMHDSTYIIRPNPAPQLFSLSWSNPNSCLGIIFASGWTGLSRSIKHLTFNILKSKDLTCWWIHWFNKLKVQENVDIDKTRCWGDVIMVWNPSINGFNETMAGTKWIKL